MLLGAVTVAGSSPMLPPVFRLLVSSTFVKSMKNIYIYIMSTNILKQSVYFSEDTLMY